MDSLSGGAGSTMREVRDLCSGAGLPPVSVTAAISASGYLPSVPSGKWLEFPEWRNLRGIEAI
jgi:hypothetical protein